MATVRDKFHELGNWHNKIGMGATTAKEALVEARNFSEKELNEAIEKAIKTLVKIEGYVRDADKISECIKSFIYEKTGADAEIFLKGKQ